MTAKNNLHLKKEEAFKAGQTYFQNQVDLYRQRIAKLDAREESPAQVYKKEDEKHIKAFDNKLDKNKTKQRELMLEIIADYEGLKTFEKEQFDSGKNPANGSVQKSRIEDGRNRRVAQLNELSASALHILYQKKLHLEKLQEKYAHEFLSHSQKALLEMIASLFTNKNIHEASGVTQMKFYLTTPSSFSPQEKLEDLTNIANSRLAKAASNSQVVHPDLKDFHLLIANMKFETQLEVDTTIKELKNRFPEAKTKSTQATQQLFASSSAGRMKVHTSSEENEDSTPRSRS